MHRCCWLRRPSLPLHPSSFPPPPFVRMSLAVKVTPAPPTITQRDRDAEGEEVDISRSYTPRGLSPSPDSTGFSLTRTLTTHEASAPIGLFDARPEVQGARSEEVTASEVRRRTSVYSREEYRTVLFNDMEGNASNRFPNNSMRTTKYTVLTFLPVNLFEQFRRVANFYFLVSAIIALVPGISPFLPISFILPLLFVLGVTAVKEAWEDYQRHKQDKIANFKTVTAVRRGVQQEIFRKDIQVGDIVFVRRGEQFPADLLLLSSSEEQGFCFIETSNLDGETSLKLKKASDITAKYNTEAAVSSLKGRIECEHPSELMYEFKARMALGSWESRGRGPKKNEGWCSLSHQELLLRGASLRNTHWIFGIALYTGVDTKLFRNLEGSSSKFSRLERRLNKQVLALLVINITFVILCAALSGEAQARAGDDSWFLDKREDIVSLVFRNILTYFILLGWMVPISLYVSVELVRFIQARMMEWDNKLFSLRDDGLEVPLKVRTSNLHEELGQVEYIFADKTGTLTQNKMEFVRASIGGRFYDEADESGGIAANRQDSPEVVDFLRVVSLCNTVVPEEREEKEPVYQGESPDEIALVHGMYNNGIILKGRKGTMVILSEFGIERTYEVLAVLEFHSTRKRMSVVVRTPEGKILLLTKGADEVILERLKAGHPSTKTTQDHIQHFAEQGLRTLVIAMAELTEDIFAEWGPLYYEAQVSLTDREEKIHDACEQLEKNLCIVGVTAVEDRLQDDVPATLHYLLQAGIVVWLLTGDMMETAINIGFSSRLIPHGAQIIRVRVHGTQSNIQEELETCQKEKGTVKRALVIDGLSLHFALEDHAQSLLDLASMCCSVICCRVTPLQKALVVHLVKEKLGKHTLAIGDGANDVSMILAADVGVGIVGREGTQAARSSDYSIGELHLRRLLAVQGRWCYLRLAAIVQYSFYKNMAITLPQVFFSFYDLFSAQTLYDSWIVSSFNVFFASLPPLIWAIVEKDVDSDVIDNHPQLYRRLQKAPHYDRKTITAWLMAGIWHGTVLYFLAHGTFAINDVFRSNGQSLDFWAFGLLASTLVIVTVNLKIALHTIYWTWLNHVAIWGSLVVYLIFLSLYTLMHDFQSTFYYVFYVVTDTGMFWLSLIVFPIFALLPDFVVNCQRTYFPTDWQVVQEMYKAGTHEILTQKPLTDLV